MNWLLLGEIFYFIIIILVCLKIVYDTGSSTKASAYILLVLLVPLIGIFIYFSFGINYRKRKMYSKSLFSKDLESRLIGELKELQEAILVSHSNTLSKYSGLVNLVSSRDFFPVTTNNEVRLLINGENKFPVVLEKLEHARHHIHIEYYIFEPDEIGNQIIDLLIKKAKQGIKVRFIYDDFGSQRLRKKQLRKMREAGVEAFPFYKIKLIALANSINYRNHRKIVVVDGTTGFIGGINVSDKYINNPVQPGKLFWRDTHLMIEGPAFNSLQYIFMVDWNYCSKQQLQPGQSFFPQTGGKVPGGKLVQIVASGPDSDTPLIQQSICKAISLAKKEVLITSPYFIPGETVKDTIIIAAQSGIEVKLLVPGISDSVFVNMANHSHFSLLLEAGVNIYTYEKGFVHAKTIVIDEEIAMVGTANMDLRSFDLNFEVNAIAYDNNLAMELRRVFFNDLNDAIEIDAKKWRNRPKYRQLLDKIVRLVSPLM
ncbi:MAG: cardiolipin synthase [Chitinophagaceae bacterium]|nr:MAG: cardiolipin synthase [Chitinophagaceae bacterium]